MICKKIPDVKVVPPENRNYGIDTLRILSMLYVLILHTLGKGGILKTAVPGSIQFAAAWFLEMIANTAVDIFALISGYVSFCQKEKKVNYANYVMLWLQVVSYGIAISVVGKMIIPTAVGKKDLLLCFFPVLSNRYWYFTAYTAVFAVSPLINKAIWNASEDLLKKIFVGIILVFSGFDVVAKRFLLDDGYSFVWIALLYILGAILKKCQIGKKKKSKTFILWIIFLTFIGWIWKLWGLEFKFLNVEVTGGLSASYVSPTVLISSILYVLLFSRFEIEGIFKKFVVFAAPSAFSAYIINNHFFVWRNIMAGRFSDLAGRNTALMLSVVISFSICFLLLSILVDKVRDYVFRILNLRKVAENIALATNNIISIVAKSL